MRTVQWPEIANIRSFVPYDHQLPFVFDRAGSKARWSYGQPATSPSFRASEAALKEPGLPTRVLAFGFDAVVVEKAAYAPAELETLLAGLRRAVAPACIVFDDRFRMFARLSPQANGAPCLTQSP